MLSLKIHILITLISKKNMNKKLRDFKKLKCFEVEKNKECIEIITQWQEIVEKDK